MSVIYDTATKTDRMAATRQKVANGALELVAADNSVLAAFPLSATAGSVANDVWTLGFAASAVTGKAGAGTGTNATKAHIKDSGGTVRISGLTVAQSGADITLTNTNIASGQSVELTSATITHAPDAA